MSDEMKTHRDGEPGTCGNCGAQGHHCTGPSEDGPSHDDWIGMNRGRPCCHSCYGEQKEPDNE